MCFIVLFIKNILTSLKISIFNLCFHDIVTLTEWAWARLHRVCTESADCKVQAPVAARVCSGALAAAVLQCCTPGPVLLSWPLCTNFAEYIQRFATFLHSLGPHHTLIIYSHAMCVNDIMIDTSRYLHLHHFCKIGDLITGI